VVVPRSLIDRVRSRWRASTQEHRSIFTAVLSVAAFSLLGKLATAAKEVAVAWRFGVSTIVDAYLFVFNLVNWVVLIWFSVLTVVLIPLEARLRRESPEQLRTFRRELLGATIVVGLLLAAVAEMVIPVLLRSHAVGLPPRTAGSALEIVPTLAWLALVGPLVALYSTWMMSGGRNANTLLEGVPSLAILAAVLLTGGIDSLVWGTLVGVVVQLVCVAWPRIRSGDVGAPAFGLSSSAWGPFARGFALVLVGQVIFGVTTLIDQFFAASLGEGAISSLGYAARVVGLLNGVVAITATRATLPVFSRATATDARRIRRVAFQWAALLGLAGAAAALIGLMSAPWIAKVLFERGTFTAHDTERVATLLRFGLLQLPFSFYSLVFVSLHSSRGAYRVLLLSGVLGLTVKVAAIWLLIGTFGVGALMMSTALMYLANMLLLLSFA
jgi:putative peptidoglycan lipid II flippase